MRKLTVFSMNNRSLSESVFVRLEQIAAMERKTVEETYKLDKEKRSWTCLYTTGGHLIWVKETPEEILNG
jgi:hypothetical protein